MNAERGGLLNPSRRKFLQWAAGATIAAAVTSPRPAEAAPSPAADQAPSNPETDRISKKEVSEKHTLTKLQELFPDRDKEKMKKTSTNFEGVWAGMQQELNDDLPIPSEQDREGYDEYIQKYWKKLDKQKENNQPNILTDPWNDALIDAHPNLSNFNHSAMKEQVRSLFIILAPPSIIDTDADPKWGQTLAKVLHGAVLGINHPETNQFLKEGKRPPKLEDEKGAISYRNHELDQEHYTRALLQGILLATDYYESPEDVSVKYTAPQGLDITSVGGTLIQKGLESDLSIMPDESSGLGKFNIEATNGVIHDTNEVAKDFQNCFKINVIE